MTTIKMTSKRQATFPRELCEEMHIRPGDMLEVEPKTVEGRRVWVLAPAESPPMAWVGSLARYATGKPHTMESLRQKITEALARGDLD